MYRIAVERVTSRLLSDNPLGDPAERDLVLLVPESLPAGLKVPVIWCLVGYTGVGKMMLQDDPWQEGLRERVERLSAAGKLGPAIYALPDAFTRYGGSQYLNSTALGPYEDYLWTELFPHVTERYRCGRHGVMGKSSGGYGALVQAMRHPDRLSAVACHSGDMYFEYCYLPDFPKFLNGLRTRGGLDGYLAAFEAAPKKRDTKLLEVMNVIAMAAAYSPDPASPTRGIDFPIDLETGEIRREVWERWLALDPVRLVERHQDALRSLRLVYIDCGLRDEFHLQYGARIFAQRLRALGIPHVHEEFDDGHMGVSYRYERSLPLLYQALRDEA